MKTTIKWTHAGKTYFSPVIGVKYLNERKSFHVGETKEHSEGLVPEYMVEQIIDEEV